VVQPTTVRWRFARGDATADELQAAVDEVLRQQPPGWGDAAVRVREGEQGAEPVLTTIVVTIAASVGSTVVESFWDDVVWPYLRRRLGVAALGKRVDGDRADGGRTAGDQPDGA